MEYLTQEIRRGSCYTAASNLCIVVQDFTVSMHSTACATKSFRVLVPICSRGSVGSLNEISCNNMPWWFWSKGFPTLFSGLLSATLYDLQMTQRNTYSCQQLMNHSWVKQKSFQTVKKRTKADSCFTELVAVFVKARLHRRFLSRKSMQCLSRLSCNFKIARVNQVRFSVRFVAAISQGFRTCLKLDATFVATKIAWSCRDKNRLCKRALRLPRQLPKLVFAKDSCTFTNIMKVSQVLRVG